MNLSRNTSCGSVLLTFAFALLVLLHWPQGAAAFHVQGFSLTVTSVDSVTRKVDVTLTETTIGTGSPHSGAVIQWGDAVTSFNAWTSSTGAAPKIYRVSVSHTYPDLTTRMITATGDTNIPSPFQDTAMIDFGCSDAPMGGCRAAGKSQLQIKNDADDSKDKLTWKWLKGADTSLAALGNPTVSTQYFLCIYAPGLVLDAIVPNAIGVWSAAGSTGFKYKELGGGFGGGVTQIKLKSGTGAKAKVLVKGAGASLDDPLPLTQPVTVQLQNNIGECWAHQFSSPETENSAAQFKDKEP